MNNTRRPTATAIQAGLSKLSWLGEPIQSKSRARLGLGASERMRGADQNNTIKEWSNPDLIECVVHKPFGKLTSKTLTTAPANGEVVETANNRGFVGHHLDFIVLLASRCRSGLE